MRTGHTSAIRRALRRAPDGLSTADLYYDVLGGKSTRASMLNLIRRMPDTYVKAWQRVSESSSYEAIWAVVIPPPDAAHPGGRYSKKP